MQKGFTLVELMIVVAMVGAVAAIMIPWIAGGFGASGSLGLNGYTEMRCINGYTFTVDRRGNTRQVMSEQGHGVPCKE